MEIENAIKILIDTANIAQKGGLLSLQDAAIVLNACETSAKFINQLVAEKQEPVLEKK